MLNGRVCAQLIMLVITLYEASSKADDAKGNSKGTVKPYVYIDFHPEYNFCLTAPQHMTVDPYKCFIPLAASNDEYLQIYDESIRELALKGVAFKSGTENYVSTPLSSFKTDNAYRGKTMEILLNTQYLLDLANQFVSADKQATIALKPFLDALMQDINKSTGNFNVFRVQYRDDSNTIIIKDDQYTPELPGEQSTIVRETFLNNRRFMELQIFGSGSLVRNMDFKTNMNTKMSSMIAISAQAGQQYANGVDATPLAISNENFQDAFMSVKQNADSGSLGDTLSKLGATSIEDASTIIQNQLSQGRTEAEIKQLIGESAFSTITERLRVENNNKDTAEKFNDYVINVYRDGNVPLDQTNSAVNYYIDRMSVVKGSNEITKGGPFIPANLGITIDGISGIVMGNAFVVPENRLPASLRGFDGNTKVGFVVVGLTHMLENNQWLTKIRGQMIRLRQKIEIATTRVSSTVNNFIIPADSSSGGSTSGGSVTTSQGCTTAYPELPIITSGIQTDFFPITSAAKYLKDKYPTLGVAGFAIITAEAGKSGDSFRSAGGNNFGGVQLEGRWGFGTFAGQFCRRDSGGDLRMFAIFKTPQDFLDFAANRLLKKGFKSSLTGDEWTTLYINKWWSPNDKAQYTKGTKVYNEKLSIYNSALKIYNQV